MSTPNYRCHKEVYAFKIKEVSLGPFPCCGFGDLCSRCALCQREVSEPPAAILIPEGRELAVSVNRQFLDKHKPEAGGYFVEYADGYQSFSPAKAFEDGYRPIPYEE